MWPDPEPHERVRSLDRNRSMMQPDTSRPEAPHLFEMDRRMLGILFRQLESFVGERRPRNVSRWVDAATYARVSEALRATDSSALRPVFERLGGQVPYEVIRVVARHLEVTALGDAGPAPQPPI